MADQAGRSKNEIHAMITDDTERDDIIMELARLLAKHGMVDETYGSQVLQREEGYPTGVPTQPYAVAIPHSDRSAVSKTGVGVAVLRRSAPFVSMEDGETYLDVKVVFMLAVASDDGHLDIIEDIMEIIQDKALVASLLSAADAAEAEEIINREFYLRESRRQAISG